jgi:hypothetical protein
LRRNKYKAITSSSPEKFRALLKFETPCQTFDVADRNEELFRKRGEDLSAVLIAFWKINADLEDRFLYSWLQSRHLIPSAKLRNHGCVYGMTVGCRTIP